MSREPAQGSVEAILVPLEDLHVHTQWSWDAPRGDMEASCARAIDAGLTAVAFTEHADFNELAEDPRAVVHLGGYLDAVAECRKRFPGLVIRTGVELGQPNMYPRQTAELLASAGGPLDRVLGSMHVAEVDGRLVDVSSAARQVRASGLPDLVRSHLRLTHDLVDSDAPFRILAHLEYAKRYWAHELIAYQPGDYREEYHAVLEAAASRQLVLEINSTRGGPPQRALGPGLEVLRWWFDAGGAAVCFGSDAHEPRGVGRGFAAAAQLAAAAGFHPTAAGDGTWGRRLST